MTRTTKFFYNALSSLLMQFVVTLSGMIIPRVMLKAYGSEINGLVSSISQFVSYFSLVEAGLAAASVYALYKPLSDNDSERISAVVCESKKFYFQTGYIFSALVIILSFVYPFIAKTQHLSNIQIGLLTLAIGCSLALSYFVTAKYRVLLTADQRNYVLNFLSIVSQIAYTLIVVVMTKSGFDIVLLRIVAISHLLITPVFLHFYMKKKYPNINYKAEPAKGSIKQRWDALLLQILGTVHTSFPVIVATIFTSLKEVSVYSIYNMVVLGVQHIMGVFGTGLSASFGELLAKKEYETFRKAYDEYEWLTYFIITVMLSCTMILLQPFVDIYTTNITDTNYHRPLIGFLFVVNALFFCVKNPQGSLVSSAGLFKDTKKQTITQAAIAIVVSLILVKPLGIVGILIGRILSNVYRVIDLLVYIPRKIGYISIKKSFLRVFAIAVQMCIICSMSVWLRIDVSTFFEWVLYAIIVFIFAFIVAIVFSIVFDNKTFVNVLRRFKTLINTRRKA